MNDVINQTEEILGLKSVSLTVGDEDRELILRPLTIKQQIALQHEKFASGHEALLAEAHESARRGGYEGTRNDLAELLIGDDLLRIEEAMKQLVPLSFRRVEEAKPKVDPEVVAMMLKAFREMEPALSETSGALFEPPDGASKSSPS